METYFTGIAVLVLSAVISLFLKNQKLKLKLISISAVIASIFTVFTGVKVLLGQTVKSTFHLGSIFQNVSFVMDNLSAFFVIFISIMSSLALIYANGYLAPYIEKGKDVSAHCVFLTLLMASMLGVVTVQNALMFLIIWELMSLSSFFLVIFESEKKEVISAGIKYLVYMHVSVVFIILLFALLSINASSLDFAAFKESLQNADGLVNLIFIFGFIGFGIKAGFVPFHNWLPDAHPAAPSHVSAMMSGVMIKTGIYGILRILTLIGTLDKHICYFVLIISLVSALYGVLYAIGQHDIKRLLAYHSIENIGIIGIGIAIGMLGLAYNNSIVTILGFSGGILHVLNHSIFKEMLFLGAGAVYNKTHTRNIEVLGGLIKPMAKTGMLFLIASVAICGLPPFNGFVSEFFIYFGMLNGLLMNDISIFILMLFALAGLALVGTMAILCFTKVFSIVFLGTPRSKEAQDVKEDVSISFTFPMTVLAVFVVLIGLFPNIVYNIMLKITSEFTPAIEYLEIVDVSKVISITCFAIIIATVVLFLIKRKTHEKYVTWGCGYNKEVKEAQYSASSYAAPFLNTLKPLFKRVSAITKPKTIFPKDAHYELHVEDIEEAYFVEPIVKMIEKFFSKFEKIQNGNIQQYIMYGLIFLLVSLVGIVILG